MSLQVGVKALIKNDDDQYLFIRRTDKLLDGSGIRWDIPGGRIRTDESLMDGLRRDVTEETGLALSESPKLLDAQDILVPDANLHVVRLTYSSTATGTVTLSADHAQYKWVALHQAKQLNIDNYLCQTIESLEDKLS